MTPEDREKVTQAGAVVEALGGGSRLKIPRCKFCQEALYLDSNWECTQPECFAKASRERTDRLLDQLRQKRNRT